MATTYLAAYPRIWSSGPALEHIHVIEGKTTRIDHVFVHYCAMVMLGAPGYVLADGTETHVESPFVLLARPGQRYRYGPDTTWDEVGLVFRNDPDPSELEQFPTAPWSARSPVMLQEQLATLERLLQNPAVPGVVDQLDLLARAIITSSFYGAGEDIPEGPLQRLYAAEAWMRTHYHESFELQDVIRRFGFSEPTFRRLWTKHFSTSPWQYVLELRLRASESLLRGDPTLPIGEIAYSCGFSDQRYFATLFKRETGKAPSDYRNSLRG